MKTTSPLLAACLAATSIIHAQEWQSLSGIGDKLELRKGETALIVSVSGSSYVKVDKPGRHPLALRLEPREDTENIWVQVPHQAASRRRVEVDWKHPFPVAGPCTVELRSPSVMTVRIDGPRPEPRVASAP